MNRRQFLTGFSINAESDRPVANRRFDVVLTAGSPRQYRTGMRVLVEESRVWLCRDEIGFYAVDATCPHLGSLIRPLEDGFMCPCHYSQFNAAGERIAGPTERGLRFFYVDLDEAGQLVIRRDRPSDPDDRLIA